MKKSLDHFRDNFGSYPIPRILGELLAFQEISPEWYSWGFELSVIPQEDLKGYVKDDTLPQFFCFGHDLNYSVYALWRYKEMPLDEAPVVYFNSEGEGSTVLASNLLAFLTLLACDEEPILGIYPETADEEIEHTERNQEFRAWLEKQYHLQAALSPHEVVQNAQLYHPRLPLCYAQE